MEDSLGALCELVCAGLECGGVPRAQPDLGLDRRVVPRHVDLGDNAAGGGPRDGRRPLVLVALEAEDLITLGAPELALAELADPALGLQLVLDLLAVDLLLRLLLLVRLRVDVHLPPSRVGQQVAIGIATEAVQPPGSTDSPERRSA